MINVMPEEISDWQADVGYIAECVRKITKQVLLIEQSLARLKLQLADAGSPSLLRVNGEAKDSDD